MSDAPVPVSVELFETLDHTRAAIRTWLTDRAADLAGFRHDHPGDIPESVAHFGTFQAMLHDDGWTTLGWPIWCGGRGGSALHRAVVLEEIAAAGYVLPEMLGTTEIISPMLIRYAPHLAVESVARAIRGDEGWCQGFSEPEAGSDLASLRTRAVADGDGFVINGQKMWSSYGTVAQRCCVLARTGAPDSADRGLSMFWVDLGDPGVTIVPTMCASGRAEVAELFFDDVRVAPDRLIGEVGQGWAVVMYLLQFERGAYAWKRQAEMHSHLQEVIDHGLVADEATARSVGEAYLSVLALRSQCSPTFARLASGIDLGPEISLDKLLLGACEQQLTDSARNLLFPALELDDGVEAAMWRRRWSYARITTIYGGAAEVQRDLVAERLLGLPRGR